MENKTKDKSVYIKGELLNEIFDKKFKESYKKIRIKNKAGMLRYIQAIYKKWLYSVIFGENILVTPALLLEKFSYECAREKETVSYNVKSKSLIKLGKIEYIPYEYSTKEHQVINDIRIMLDECFPDITLENGLICEEAMSAVIDNVSIYDEDYVMYLFELAKGLKLITKRPSINATVYKIKDNYKKSLEKNTEDTLKKIVDISIKKCKKDFCKAIPVEFSVFTEDYIREMLKKQTATDDVFKDQLSVFDPANIDEKNLPEHFGEMMMSLVYILGIIYDKSFLTVFGHYLKIIRYIYYTPYDFYGEMLFIAEGIKNVPEHADDEGYIREDYLYSPCSIFEPTPLGEKIFGIEHSTTSVFNAFKRVSADKTLNCMMKGDLSGFADIYIPKPYDTSVYEIKVTDKNDTKMWRVYEIEDDFELSELHDMIDMTFDTDYSDKYSFFLNEEMDVFNKYTPNAKNKDKDTNEVAISSLMKNEKDKIYYKTTVADLTGIVEDYAYIIELKKIKKSIKGERYPIVKKSSKKVIDCMGR
ncbi:MAG: hypothetical protein IJ583_01520 [Firmicutes bacterium]|nr:hypothetical protein [Bacillota bacterium]